MSLGTGLPYCWLCANFRREDRSCFRHSVVIPVTSGLTICGAYNDPQYDRDEWYLNFKAQKLNEQELFVYAESSSFEERIPFSKLFRS